LLNVAHTKASSCWPTDRPIRLGLGLVQAGSAKVQSWENPLPLAAGNTPEGEQALLCPSAVTQPAASRCGEIKFNNIIKWIPKKWKFGGSTYCSPNLRSFALASADFPIPKARTKNVAAQTDPGVYFGKVEWPKGQS
jgi:hypothetical protein